MEDSKKRAAKLHHIRSYEADLTEISVDLLFGFENITENKRTGHLLALSPTTLNKVAFIIQDTEGHSESARMSKVRCVHNCTGGK